MSRKKCFPLLSVSILLVCGCQSYGNKSFQSLSTNYQQLNNPNNQTSIGTNLGGIAHYSTQVPFINYFKSSGKLITQCKPDEVGCQGKWDTEEYDLLDLDENGWLKSLPSLNDSPEYTYVSVPVLHPHPSQAGKYIILYDGEGTIEYPNFTQITKIQSESKTGRDVVETKNGEIFFSITKTDPHKTGNYIRNIRVIKAEQESLFNQGEIFNPLFLEKTQPFSTLRFMDWMATNNSQQKEWSDRPQIPDSSYSLKGVPIEIMVALANKLKKDAWFNMPHQAKDEYMINFARLVKDNLNSELKVYVEFSNEVWNWQFAQAQYAMQQAKQRWGQEGNARMDWYGMRTAQMCNIWKEVFAEQQDRVICVMSTQRAWKGLEKGALDCPLWVAEGNKPCYQQGISAYGITGYFGGALGYQENKLIVKSWLNQVDGGFQSALQQLKEGGLFPAKQSQDSLKEAYDDFIYHRQVAQEKGLQLVAYEGGQHIVGVGEVSNDTELTNFFIELNRNPEMYRLYQKLLSSWQESGGGLFMHFSDIGQPSQWGSWGTLEYLNQPTSPKYKALMDFINTIESGNKD
jgi:hypothetical protein